LAKKNPGRRKLTGIFLWKNAVVQSAFYSPLGAWWWFGVVAGIKRVQDDSVFFVKDAKQQMIFACAWFFRRRKSSAIKIKTHANSDEGNTIHLAFFDVKKFTSK
jgi:hypothetical protein